MRIVKAQTSACTLPPHPLLVMLSSLIIHIIYIYTSTAPHVYINISFFCLCLCFCFADCKGLMGVAAHAWLRRHVVGSFCVKFAVF